MDKILAPIKQRILSILDEKGVKKGQFFAEIGLAASNFRGISLYSEVGGDTIVKVLTTFPDVRPEWLLTGKGEMLKRSESIPASKVSEPEPNYCQNKQLTELLELQKKHIQLVEEMLNAQRAENERLKKELEAKNHNKTIPADVEYGRKLSEYFPQSGEK